MRAAVVALFATGCANGAPADPTTPPPVAMVVEAAVPENEPMPTLAERMPPEFSPELAKGFADACGSCHDSRLATAKPEALAIFDLVDPQWLVALPEARRACTLERIGGDAGVGVEAKDDLARIIEGLRES